MKLKFFASAPISSRRRSSTRCRRSPAAILAADVASARSGLPIRTPCSAAITTPTARSASATIHTVRIERWADPPLVLDDESRPRFFSVLRAGFSEPRKQLHNAIANSLGLPDPAVLEVLAAAAVPPDTRAQHLDLQDWMRLHQALERMHPRTLDVV